MEKAEAAQAAKTAGSDQGSDQVDPTANIQPVVSNICSDTNPFTLKSHTKIDICGRLCQPNSDVTYSQHQPHVRICPLKGDVDEDRNQFKQYANKRADQVSAGPVINGYGLLRSQSSGYPRLQKSITKKYV